MKASVGLPFAVMALHLAAVVAQPPTGSAVFLTPRLLWQDRPLGRVLSVNVVDVDSDGRDELCVGTQSGEIAVLGQAKVVRTLKPFASPVWRVAVEDLDGKGRKAILAVSGGSLRVLALGGQELWNVEPHLEGNAVGTTGVECADLDGDGTREVLTFGDEMACWDARGKLAWTFASKARSCSFADLDRDGRQEIVLVNPLTVLNHDGRVRWAKPIVDSKGPNSSLHIADVIGDPSPEVILTSRDKMEVFDANGNLLSSTQTDGSSMAVKSKGTKGEAALRAAACSNYEVQVWDGEGKPLYKVALAPRGSGAVVGPVRFIALENQPELVVGTHVPEAYVTAIDGKGEIRWKYYVGGSVGVLSEAEMDGDAGKEVVVLADAIYVLDGNGELLWWLPAGANTTVVALPAAHGAEGAVFAGASTVRRYKANGDLVWESDVPFVNDMTLANLDSDPEEEILVGGEDNVVLALEPDGSIKWQNETLSPFVRVLAANLDDDPQSEVVAADWYTCYAFDNDGRQLWRLTLYQTALEYPRGLSVGKLSGGTRDQVFLWCDRGFHVLSPSGVQLWEAHIGEVPAEVQVGDFGKGTTPKAFVLGKESLRTYSPSGELVETFTGVAKNRRRDWFMKGRGLLFHDLDGDGKAEIVAGLGSMETFLPGGDHFWLAECRCAASTLQMGDLDGDGKKEIVTAYQGPTVVSREGETVGRWPDREITYTFSVADIDGDGHDEVVTGGSGPVVLGFRRP